MKIQIPKETELKLIELKNQIIEINPYAQKSLGAICNSIITAFIETDQRESIQRVANKLTTKNGKLKALQSKLCEMMRSDDPSSFKVVERALDKVSRTKSITN